MDWLDKKYPLRPSLPSLSSFLNMSYRAYPAVPPPSSSSCFSPDPFTIFPSFLIPASTLDVVLSTSTVDQEIFLLFAHSFPLVWMITPVAVLIGLL